MVVHACASASNLRSQRWRTLSLASCRRTRGSRTGCPHRPSTRQISCCSRPMVCRSPFTEQRRRNLEGQRCGEESRPRIESRCFSSSEFEWDENNVSQDHDNSSIIACYVNHCQKRSNPNCSNMLNFIDVIVEAPPKYKPRMITLASRVALPILLSLVDSA